MTLMPEAAAAKARPPIAVLRKRNCLRRASILPRNSSECPLKPASSVAGLTV